MAYSPTNWYWRVTGDLANVWSSASFSYVPNTDNTYQSWLTAGNSPNNITDQASLSNIMTNQVIPAYLSTGIIITSTSNSALNSTYALDPLTVDQIGTVARDSACGLGLPLGLATFTYPDINGRPQAMSISTVKALYIAMRDYIAGVNISVNALVFKQQATIPSNKVTIP